jgi:two-component system invasion response regulator UvrY
VIKVLLVDDHELVRTGIRRLLEDTDDIQVVGEAESGEEAIKLARELHPNVVMMDAKMPGIGGLEATRKMSRQFPDIKIIVLSAHTEEPYPSSFLQAGAAGYMTKGSGSSEMVHAIRAVNAGQRYLTPSIAQNLAFKSLSPDKGSPIDGLSERELQVMTMISEGQKVQDISDKLCLSSKTVNTYRYRLFEKLNVTSDVELTHVAIRHGVVDPQNLS